METPTYVQGGKDQCFGGGISLWVRAWARRGAVASPSSSLRPDAPYYPPPTCSANLPEGCLERKKSLIPTDEGRGRFRGGPGGGGEPGGKEGEEEAVSEGRGEGSGPWKMTIGAAAFAKWSGKSSVAGGWLRLGRDRSLTEAAAGKQVWEQTGASLRSGGPGTIWKTSASFARAIATHLKLGRDGVS